TDSLLDLGVNIKNFGASGLGQVDETDFIIDAINFAKEHNIRKVFFTEGVYNLSTIPLGVINGLELIGLNAKINFIGSGNLFEITNHINDLEITGFEFDG